MKNKKLTYVLGFLVAAVWGLIIYRVVDAAGGGDDDESPVATKTVKEVYNDYAIPQDTTKLLLNYKDPFAIKKQKDTSEIPVKKLIANKIPVQPVKPVNWSFIKYTGYVHNPGSKNLIALVNINGKTLMMAEGETEEQVKLVKNLKDSIQISYNGKTTYLKIRTGTL